MVELRNVSRRFGRQTAVKDLSLTVRKGEVLGLLGPNGAGKTTTLRMIAGFLAPTSGQIRVSGYDTIQCPLEARRRVGYLPEAAPGYREMTVVGFLQFMAGLKGIGRKQDRNAEVERVINVLDLSEVRSRTFGNLSRGYRQRVGLGQALLANPDVLLLDEPTAGMDPVQVAAVRTLLRALREDHAILVSSHIIPEIQATCQRIAVIDHGRLLAHDTLSALSGGLTTAQRLFIRIRAPRAQVEEVLRSFSGVSGVWLLEYEETRELGSWLVEQGPTLDIREQLTFRLAQNCWSIFELTSSDLSLEAAFLNLTTKS